MLFSYVYKFENGYALLSGGNVSDTAKIARRIKVDDDGFVLDDINDYKIILKKKSTMPWIPIIGFLLGATVLIGVMK